MTKRFTVAAVTIVLVFAALSSWPVRAATTVAKPEELGFSTERLERIAELMQRHIDAHTFSGAVTLVARNGRVGYFRAQGLMDIDSNKPMPRDGIFRIMSMTKPIVGTAVMMMIEEGKVRLTDPVARFIPEMHAMRVSGGTLAERDITIRDLLTHTSGLMSGGASNSESRTAAAKAGEGLAQVLPRVAAVPLDFQPGTRWAYSAQYGFDTLVRVVEIASGMPFDRFAKQRIFDPLAMKDTFFYPTDGNPRVVTLYSRMDGALKKQTNPAFMNGVYFSGGGGLFSTAEDYFQFAQMLLNGGQLNGKRLLSPRSVELMSSVFVPDTLPGRTPGEGYGLSMRVITDPAKRNTFLTKGSFGWSGAYNTHFWVDPKEKIVGVMMTQTAGLTDRGEIRNAFEDAVMQALVGGASTPGTN
jgi:CubicO group peptidase (beta-lactamase class C family)